MHPMPVFILSKAIIFTLLLTSGNDHKVGISETNTAMAESSVCNCSITQGGNTYTINSLIGNETAPSFYDYGNPSGSSSNTGLELSNALILFLYEDMNTGVISLFLIGDIANSGSGGSLTFEFNCAPPASFISVQDDSGEFSGSPPLFTGNWNWGACCTDGGVIENIGCTNNLSLDLLVSNGIDSIVWITGDIANPVHILLDLTGEDIMINCGGGGVCCPVGLDTEVIIVDATCDDSPNGSIVVNPQDGIPPYMYNWSNGETASSNTDLLPGSYMLTVTDSQGCSEELQMTVDVSPGDPPGQSAMISLCSPFTEDVFDLTSVDGVINLGSSFNVLWFENVDMTGMISNPSNYLSGSTTVYAVVDNGPCLSDVYPVILTIIPQPVANETSLNLCEEENGNATFDLTSLEDIVNLGAGNVMWYMNANLTNLIPNPSEFYSNSQTVYAVVDDGDCISEPAEVQLIVEPKPEGQAADAHMCSDGFDQAIFDLTLLEPQVSGGNGSVDWYLEIELLDQIINPDFFQTTTTTVYAVLFDGLCFSDPIPVELIVEPTPIGNPVSIQSCDDGSGMAIFNLPDFDNQISGGAGGVDWFLDEELLDPVNNPGSFMTFTTIVYAVIDNGTCFSDPVSIMLNVVESPVGIPASLETCADNTGQGIFNLTSLDNIVNGGLGTVLWYEDALGFDQISQPVTYASNGGTVYAQISFAGCLSSFVPVELIIVSTVSATPAQISICDDGTASFEFNLLDIANAVSGGSGQVNWFFDMAGTQTIPFPNMVITGGDMVVFASVTAGTCVSDIVPIQLIVLPSPVSFSTSIAVCGDANGQIFFDLTSLNLTVSGGIGNVTWYSDPLALMSITNPDVFLTGDTIIYAAVSNGICSSGIAAIQISVSSALTANGVNVEYCIPDGDTLFTNLTQFDATIGIGPVNVIWYTDPLGVDTILNTNSFPLADSEILYAHTTDGVCVSEIVPVSFSILSLPVANSFSIEKCGDANGQVTVDLTSVDTIISEHTGTVTWYSDLSLTSEITDPENFLTGETIVYATVTNGFCESPVVEISINIVENLSINTATVEVCITDNETAIIDLTSYNLEISGGNGTVLWFNDMDGLDPISNPQVFETEGNPLYAMVTADGCISNLELIPVEFVISITPTPVCIFSSTDSIAFSWLGNADEYEISYTVNNLTTIGPLQTSASDLNLGDLDPGDMVLLTVTALYDSVCVNGLTNSITCSTEECPDATITIQDPGHLCEDGDPVMLEAVTNGVVGMTQMIWSGDAIIDPSGIFDPSLAKLNGNKIHVTITDGVCSYTDSIELSLVTEQVASFVITGSPCVDSTLELLFNGEGFGSADWYWDFDGAEAIPTSFPFFVDFDLKWDHPGDYIVSLFIDYNGCVSDTFKYPVTIGEIPDELDITCIDEEYYSVTVGWEPVIGATSYVVSSDQGTGILSGTTYTISNLPDDTPVEITVEAIGDNGCGNSKSSIQCRTLDFISPEIYIPDIFSPNDDGINDVFYVHTNSRISEVNAMRIFDRWGNIVYEAVEFFPNDEQYGWKGLFSGKPMNPGVYTYWVELENSDGDIITMVGDLTLIR